MDDREMRSVALDMANKQGPYVRVEDLIAAAKKLEAYLAGAPENPPSADDAPKDEVLGKYT